ncbi:MAG: PAS domain-containing protein [Planctomycetota bacterium]
MNTPSCSSNSGPDPVCETPPRDASSSGVEALLEGQRKVLELITFGSSPAISLSELLRVIETQAPEMQCAIHRLDEDGLLLWHVAAPSLPDEMIRAFNGGSIGPQAHSSGTAALRQEPVFVEDVKTDVLWNGYSEWVLKHGFQASWASPIFDSKSQILGTFTAYYRNPMLPTAQHRKLAEMAIHIAAIAIGKQKQDAALRHSEARLAAAQAQALIGSWELDFVEHKATWSAEMYRLMGRDPKDGPIMMPGFLAYVHPKDRAGLSQQYAAAVETGDVKYFEFRGNPELNNFTTFEAISQNFKNDAGKVVAMIGTIQDITVRRKNEASLREKKWRLSQAQSIGRIGDWHYDVVTGEIVWSDVLYELFERDPKLGPPGFVENMAYYFPEDSERLQNLVARAVEYGEEFECDLHIRLSNGREAWHHTIARVEKDESGKVIGLYGIAQDINERKRYEASRREKERRLSEAQSIGRIGDWRFNILTGEVEWSGVLYELFERDPKLGPPDFVETMAYYFPEDSERLQYLVARAVEYGEDFECDLHIRLSNGREAWHHAIARVEKNESGKVIGLYGIEQDINERKRYEADVQKSEDQLRALLARLQRVQEEERTRVSREIHDDLGQLLTGLKMDVRWIERKLSELPGSRIVNVIMDRAVAASELTDTTISTVQKIAAELRPGALDRLGLAAALSQRARRFEARTDISCKLLIEESGAPLPLGVSDELFYICQEALTNVTRHSQATNVEIHLHTDATKAVLDVIDNGIGMSAAKVSESSSLGLLGMRERARQFGGAIEILHNEPQGTRVVATIPL